MVDVSILDGLEAQRDIFLQQASINFDKALAERRDRISYLNTKKFKFGQVVKKTTSSIMDSMMGVHSDTYYIILGHSDLEPRNDAVYYRGVQPNSNCWQGLREEGLRALTDDEQIPEEYKTVDIGIYLGTKEVVKITIDTIRG